MTSLVWFRRDLRTHDLPTLATAVEQGPVVPCFVFDDRLISTGRFPSAERVGFMLGCLADLRETLEGLGAGLVLRRGDPAKVLAEL
ncbi:MAG: deoxyribodipyrimidine photo-lyase, partial [Solirubrobacterales bacterium]|nr:deoxyribodipyrimidine photo-lyase [Solirubrobacterales bacterium]